MSQERIQPAELRLNQVVVQSGHPVVGPQSRGFNVLQDDPRRTVLHQTCSSCLFAFCLPESDPDLEVRRP